MVRAGDRGGMTNEQIIGTHRMRVEGDTVLTRYIGVPELVDVQAIHRHFDRVLAEHGRLFLINDMRRSGVPSAATRRWITEWARTNVVRGIASFGASLPIRMLQTMLYHASKLLGSQPEINVHHCADEAEAFAWVASQRRLLR